MKKLYRYKGKEVIAINKHGREIKGFVWMYYKNGVLDFRGREYYIGYDGGDMEFVRPHELKDIKEIK